MPQTFDFRLLPFDFLIFDCDGVLVDSEWLVARIEVETRAEFGQYISIEEYIRRYVGLSTRSPEYLASLKGLPPEFRDLMRVRVERAFHEELEAIEGVAEALEQLKHWPKAIASSSSPHEIEMMLEHVGLYHHFKGNIFSVSMVARPKPAPDVYLHAAEQNNVLPSQCLVIEDSVVGATSALAAGMTVWGFTGARHQTEQSIQRLKDLGVHRIIEHMRELRFLLSDSPLLAGGQGGVEGAHLPSWRNIPPEHCERARSLRNYATPAERKLWYRVRNEQLGVKFRRQHPIGPYIADFYCREASLIIEIDGPTHYTDEEREYDERRTHYLNTLGLRVIRIGNASVHENIEGVVERIARALTPPSPPASRGE